MAMNWKEDKDMWMCNMDDIRIEVTEGYHDFNHTEDPDNSSYCPGVLRIYLQDKLIFEESSLSESSSKDTPYRTIYGEVRRFDFGPYKGRSLTEVLLIELGKVEEFRINSLLNK
jgi:hypothetical protein